VCVSFVKATVSLVIKPTRCTNSTNLFWHKLYMFRRVRRSIIRSLFTVHSAVVYVIRVCRQLSRRTGPCCTNPYDIYNCRMYSE